MGNVSCEYNRLNGWNSTLEAAWYIRRVRVICFLWTKPTIWLLINKYSVLHKMLKNVCSEYDRWVVKTQLCKLRDTSDTLIRRSCYIPFVMLKNSTGACLWAAVLFWPPFGRSPSSSSLHSVRKYKDRLVDDIDIQTVFTLTDIVVQVTYQVQLSSMTRTVDHCVSRTVIPPGEQLIIYQGVYFAIYCRSKQVKSKKSGTYVQGNGQLQ